MHQYDESNPEKNIDFLLGETFREASKHLTCNAHCVQTSLAGSAAANAYANLLRLKREMNSATLSSKLA